MEWVVMVVSMSSFGFRVEDRERVSMVKVVVVGKMEMRAISQMECMNLVVA
jgi:hypothetical protein